MKSDSVPSAPAVLSASSGWIGAAEASRLLGVSRATLYAYVSRGRVRSQAMPGSSRARGYSRDDVERLRRRTEGRRDPDKAAAGALHWGMPVLESSITLIDGRRLYYRGHDATILSRERSLQEVASLIWSGKFDTTFPPARGVALSLGQESRLPFIARAQSMLARTSARDPLAFDHRPQAVARTGWGILWLLARAASSRAVSPTIDQTLGRAWRVDAGGVDAIRAALILCADHELNVSSFAARSVASAGSHPYAVVLAGLAALEGTKHGGASARVESMMMSMRMISMTTPSMRSARSLRRGVAERLRRGEAIDGFGHPLYRDGDPRAMALLELLKDRRRGSAELAFVLNLLDAVAFVTGERPNIDYALAALARVLRLPRGSPLMLFAIGRTIGWIGHAIEQYADAHIIRPRAKYVGVVPAAP